MMRIYNFLKDKFTFQETRRDCFCNDLDKLVINKRQLSIITSFITLLSLILFIIGFFWGQHRAIAEFNSKLINDSFADQVNYSMYSMYNDNASDEEQDEESKQENGFVNVNPGVPLQSNEQGVIDKKLSNFKYHAQLIGFGSGKNAQQFVNKLQKKGYNLLVIPRKSKGSKGKVVTWYQVITNNFDDKSKLVDYVNKIKEIEKLGEVKYITIDN